MHCARDAAWSLLRRTIAVRHAHCIDLRFGLRLNRLPSAAPVGKDKKDKILPFPPDQK